LKEDKFAAMVMHFHGYKPGRINFKLWKRGMSWKLLTEVSKRSLASTATNTAEAAEYALEKEAESKIAAQGCRCNLPYRGYLTIFE
jgi:hypothetical protein